ncbi:hypothetical protein ES332_D05G304800v1 [Gossypium tomentosum]|uniref:CR-type domain-containing protein n=2 Tax=Gossypium TaxID=3633 RepID=A0A5D2L1W7_GOSTO|nr:hypothetical protein ES332_D05G304800v1 [Gossypium tomentosum]
MANLSALPHLPQYTPGMLINGNKQLIKPRAFPVFAAKSGPLNSILKRCQKCGCKGAIECPGCKGTGKNKKNGNIFERWKCFDCQGFGLKSCPNCGQGGLTPEQRGER